MNSGKYAADLWQRAEEALRTAEADLWREIMPQASA